MESEELCRLHDKRLTVIEEKISHIHKNATSIPTIENNLEKLVFIMEGPKGEPEKGFVHRVLALESVKKIAVWFASISGAAVTTLIIAEVLRLL